MHLSTNPRILEDGNMQNRRKFVFGDLSSSNHRISILQEKSIQNFILILHLCECVFPLPSDTPIKVKACKV